MQTQQITSIINQHIPADHIHALNINICATNQQIDRIEIILKPELTHLSALGPILEQLDTLTQQDEYGDITNIKLEIDRYHELPNGDLTEAYLLDINIDS